MNATITHSDHPTDNAFAPFKPQSTDEAIVAGIIRKMLHYHILRVQLEGARPWMHEKQRVRARQQAIEARRKGFAEEREAIDSGIHVTYDDELLRQEGTRIAYLLCRDEVEEAMMIEEEIITISVNHSLYATDLEAMRIAA
jgi:hypothetical protein